MSTVYHSPKTPVKSNPSKSRDESVFWTMIIANPIVFLLLTIFTALVPYIRPTVYIGTYVVLMGVAWLFSQWNTKHRMASPDASLSKSQA